MQTGHLRDQVRPTAHNRTACVASKRLTSVRTTIFVATGRRVVNQVAPESNDKAHHRGSVRFVTLDFYRFIAACGVVFLHFFSLHTPDSLLISSTEDFALFVDFFFILSWLCYRTRLLRHTYQYT